MKPSVPGDGNETGTRQDPPGIVITDTALNGATDAAPRPRIVAFVWGGKVRPAPTLPYGRWKGAA